MSSSTLALAKEPLLINVGLPQKPQKVQIAHMASTPEITRIIAARTEAERSLGIVQVAADQLRVQHLKAELMAAFPGAVSAVFIHVWHEEDTVIDKLSFSDGRGLDIGDDNAYQPLLQHQKNALTTVDWIARLLGDDENLLKYSRTPEHEDPNGSLFVFDLTDPQAHTVDGPT